MVARPARRRTRTRTSGRPSARGSSSARTARTASSTTASRRRPTRSSRRTSGRRCTSRIGRLLSSRTRPRPARGEDLRHREPARPRRGLIDDRGTSASEWPSSTSSRAARQGVHASAPRAVPRRRRGAPAGDRWERRYELTFALNLHRAECEYLTGSSRRRERLVELALRRAGPVDPAAVTCCGSLSARPGRSRSDRPRRSRRASTTFGASASSGRRTRRERPRALEYAAMWLARSRARSRS